MRGRDSKTPRASVVIPNWNGLAHLPECFSSLAAQTFDDFEVILVDNASSDGSVAWMQANVPDAHVICRADNGGFAAAVNEGISAARGDIIVLLNNDTAAEPDWLIELVAALEDPGYDAAASCMLLYWESGSVNSAGDVYDPFQMVGHNRGFMRTRGSYEQPVRVFGACAGAAAYKRSVFDDVGLFDERFFLNAEDTDFNFRMLLAGKRVRYVPGAVVRHKLRASIDTLPSWTMDRLTIRNEMLVVAKDWPAALLFLAVVFWPYRTLRGVFPLNPRAWGKTGRNVRMLADRWRAEGEGLRMGWAMRSSVQVARRAPLTTVVRWMLVGTGRV